MDCSQILANVGRYVDLEEADRDAFQTIVKERTVRKREFVEQPNRICRHQTYVVKGALRAYFIGQEGSEHTLQFAVEDWFISDFNSYITQQPASLFVEALENSTIQQIEYEAVEALCATNPKFERFFRLVAQKAFAFSQRRVLSNLGQSAEQRYLEFEQLYPNIAHRVPQYALASYLGMSAEFLSKVRKKLALEG